MLGMKGNDRLGLGCRQVTQKRCRGMADSPEGQNTRSKFRGSEIFRAIGLPGRRLL